MNANITSSVLLSSADHLEDISSGIFLTLEEFYILLEESGQRAVDLCELAIAERQVNGESEDYISIMFAAECLKEICIQPDNDKWKAAMRNAKHNAKNLYRINQKYSDRKE